MKDPWPRLLLRACKAGDTCSAKVVLDVEPTAAIAIIDTETSCDAMWMACTSGSAELARTLIEAKGDVNSFNDTGLTCLMIAARKGHKDVIELLLQNEAKSYLRSDQGRLATDYAREQVGDNSIHMRLMEYCRKKEDWTTLEEESRQAGGNKVCGAEALDNLEFAPANTRAVNAATAQLKNMSASQLREGGQDYQQLLEQRALAEVLGYG